LELGGGITDIIFNPTTGKLFAINKASTIMADNGDIQKVPEFPTYLATVISLAIPLLMSVGLARYKKSRTAMW
jgi:hypothetical protein